MTGSFLADDSPETISSMVSLSHQHPPGYPAFTLLGKVASLMPVGGPAFRVALLAAAAAALACWLAGRTACRLVHRLGMGPSHGLIAGTSTVCLLALSWTFWSQALSAKGGVYALNACLLGALVWLTLRWLWRESRPARSLVTAGLLLGVGMGHHWMSIASALPGLLAGGLPILKRDRISWASWGVAGSLTLLGLSLYLLLPVRASTPLLLNWGRPHTAGQALWVITRAHYRPIELGKRPPGYWSERGRHLAEVAAREWTPWLLWPGAVGVALLALRLRQELWLLLGVATMVLAGVVFVAHPPLNKLYITEPFLVPVIQIWTILSGVGLGWVASRLPGRTGLTWAIPGGIALGLILVHGPRMDASRSYLSYDYGWNLLQGVHPKSVVFCEGDFDLFSLLYHHEVDRRREDVAVTAAVFLDYDWYRETAHRMLPDVIPREHKLAEYTVRPSRPLVYTSQHGGGDEVLRPVGLTLRPPLGTGYGLEDSARIWRALRFRGLWSTQTRGSPLAKRLVTTYSVQMARLGRAARGADPSLAGAAFLKAVRFPQDVRARVVNRYNLAQLLLQEPSPGKKDRRHQLGLAEEQLNRIIAEAPGYYRAYLLKGNIAFLRGDLTAARRLLRQALQALPAQGAEAERARVERILGELLQ